MKRVRGLVWWLFGIVVVLAILVICLAIAALHSGGISVWNFGLI